MDKKSLQQSEFIEVLTSVIQAYNSSWSAVKINIMTYLQLVFIPIVLFWIFILSISNALQDLTYTKSLSELSISAGDVAFSLIFFAAFIVSIAIIAPAIIFTQLESVKAKKLTINQALGSTKPFILSFAGLAVVISLAFLAGLILLIVPAFFVAFFLSYSTYIMIDKKTGISDSLNQSIELAKKYWKVTLSLMIISLVISLIQTIPLIGGIIGLVLSIVYFCIYPVVYDVIRETNAKK